MSKRVGRMSRGKNRGPFRFKDVIPPKPLDGKTAALRAARLARDAIRPKDVSKNEHHRVYGLDDEMPFGRHKGETIEFLIDTEIGYVTWLLENTDFQISESAETEYHSRLGSPLFPF